MSEIDEFSTEQKGITLWLFPDMLKDGAGASKEMLFEFVDCKKINSTNNKNIPVITVLGSCYDRDKKIIVGDFISSVWNLKPVAEFKQKYPSWKNITIPIKLLLSPDGSRINVREAV